MTKCQVTSPGERPHQLAWRSPASAAGLARGHRGEASLPGTRLTDAGSKATARRSPLSTAVPAPLRSGNDEPSDKKLAGPHQPAGVTWCSESRDVYMAWIRRSATWALLSRLGFAPPPSITIDRPMSSR